MKRKSLYINYQSTQFWPDHFRDIKVLRFIISSFIDFLKEKMHSGELSIFISGIYMLGLNARLMGIYSSYALCESHLSSSTDYPSFIMIDNKFSLYIGHYYFLSYLGNLLNTPYYLTCCCALFGYYQFALMLVDVIHNQVLHCAASNGYFVEYNSLFVFAYCRMIVAFIISVHWTFILFFPKYTKYIQILPYIGGFMKVLFLKFCKCKFFAKIYKVVEYEMEYPLRIKAAATISFGLCIAVNMTVGFT